MQFHNKELERGYGRYHAKHFMGELCVMGNGRCHMVVSLQHMYAACYWDMHWGFAAASRHSLEPCLRQVSRSASHLPCC